MLDPIINFLGGILSVCYQILPNVGLAIVLLTILINIAIFPLTLKQTRSMKAMQELQPEIKALQKKHKDDRQALNEEMVALYREKNVNPASGCLPLLLQLPIWWSLFSLLRSFRPGPDADPTRHLPDASRLTAAIIDGKTNFLGMDMVISPNDAVQDGLVGAIPYLLLVLFIIVTGYWAQRQLTARRSASGKDEELSAQARQMQTFTKIMPVFFGFISWTLLAGVDVYIAASQLVRMGSQSVIFRMDERAAATPAVTKTNDSEEPEPPKKQHPSSKKKRQKRRRN
jgi:YidC/Oxa1 family membrane protein insertase